MAARTPSADKKRGGIALRNVNSRIRLMFGENYGLRDIQRERESVPNAALRLPLLLQEE